MIFVCGKYALRGFLLSCATIFYELIFGVQILDIGADGVRENLQLVGFALGTVLTALLAIAALAFLAAIGATNGHFERNPKVQSHIKDQGCISVTTGMVRQLQQWN